jgi:hypothetical protein
MFVWLIGSMADQNRTGSASKPTPQYAYKTSTSTTQEYCNSPDTRIDDFVAAGCQGDKTSTQDTRSRQTHEGGKTSTASTASATSKSAAAVIAYDTSCEKLPRLFTEHYMRQVAPTLSMEDIRAGQAEVLETYNKMGAARWCAAMKPVADKALQW